MKRLFYIAAAAMAVLSACTKEDPIVEVGTEPESVSMPVFKATIEGPATKTTLGVGDKVEWESSDRVWVEYQSVQRQQVGLGGRYGNEPIYAWIPNSGPVYSIFSVTPDPSNASNADLTFQSFSSYTINEHGPNYAIEDDHNYSFTAIYPASLVDETRPYQPDSNVFPATQAYDGDNIGFAPMYYKGIERTFAMKNTASILAITVSSSDFSSVQSIVVSSDQWMNGVCIFIHDPESGEYIIANASSDPITDANKSITLICDASGSNTVVDGSRTFYICIPVNHYGYLQIDVTDGTTTKSMRTLKASGIDIERNMIYPINFVENYIAPAAWETALTLGRNVYDGPSSIEIETGVNVSSYTEDATHKPLNAAGTLWEVLDGQVLRIQTSSNKIIAPVNSSGLFRNYYKVESIANLNKLDMSAVTNMGSMFFYCYNLTEIIGIENLNTSNVTNMSQMFSGCSGLTALDVSNFVTSNVENMNGMFINCSGLTELNISIFVTSNVEDMASMFDGCQALQELNLSNFNTENVTDMSYMFASCQALQELNLSSFNTEKVTNMNSMFLDCQALQTLDLSSFRTSGETNMIQMFSNCSSLQSLTLGDSFEPGSDMTGMFSGCGYPTELTVYGANFNFAMFASDTMTGWHEGIHFYGY